MKTHLVTFSDESMYRAAELCVDRALRHGVDRAVPTGPSQRPLTREWLRETDFYRDNRDLLDRPRGLGYWAWKPYVILHAFNQAEDNDTVIYSDAGVEFINNVSHIIDRMDQDIFLFGNNWEHAHWCKRDVIEAVWPFGFLDALSKDHQYIQEKTWDRFGKQCQASVIFFRVSDYSRKFVAEWLKWCLYRQRFSEGVCSDEWRYLIDDSPSILPNHPEFREHRHDQSILTTLSYREGLRLHWWPAVYNRFVPGGPVFTYEKGEYQDDYPPLFHHHRLRNDQWPHHMLTEPAEANRAIALHGTK